MASLVETREKMARLRQELHNIFEEAGDEMDMARVTSIQGDSSYKAGEIRRRNAEMSELGVELERLEHLEDIKRINTMGLEKLQTPGVGAGPQFPSGGGSGGHQEKGFDPRNIKGMLLANQQYQLFREGKMQSIALELPVDVKTLVTLSTINVQATRQPLVNMALEERTVSDMMLQGGMDGNQIEYYEETTFTNNAATVAEGATKPESAVGYTLRQENARKIAHFIPATKESLDDVSFLESQLRGRLAFGVTRQEEAQILSGNNIAPNLQGLLNRTGIQTQAKGADPTPDTIYKAMQLVRGAAGLGFAEPTGVVFNPNNWTPVKLLRTADGIYIWGNPSDEGPDRIWGLPVRQTTAMTSGTALVGAFRPWAEILRREGITITMSTEHGTYWAENKVGIMAEERLGLAVYRASAFCTATGLP